MNSYLKELIGPNVSGKSNFLDVFRFVRDIVKSGGGLRKSIKDPPGKETISGYYGCVPVPELNEYGAE